VAFLRQATTETTSLLLRGRKKFRTVNYQRVDRTLSQMKSCLADGFPFVFGFTVYDSFESAEAAKTGVLQMPAPGEGVVGGHAVLAVGYDDKINRFIVRNSWGASWGQKGYFTMPYSYLLTGNLSDDFWTIRLVH
jgi:C1A family cysteine protease